MTGPRVGRTFFRVLLTAWALALALAPPALGAQLFLLPDSALGAHAMLYFDTPYAADVDMFSQAAAEGATTVRLDIYLPQVTQGGNTRDWSWLARIEQLATRYRVRVLANLMGMPYRWAACPRERRRSPRPDSCPATDPRLWGGLAGQIAWRLRGLAVSYEIWNEPDGRWSFSGTARQYGALLGAAVSAIHSVEPDAAVTNGGIMHTAQGGGAQWLRAALSAAGPSVWNGLAMLNVHIRGRERTLAPQLSAWRAFAAAQGRPGMPIWVTETGYPASTAQQFDPAFRGGAAAQARFLSAALPALYDAGAAKVFVTQRDMGPGSGPYASEGVLAGLADPVPSRPAVTRRPAFYACQQFAEQHQAPSSPLGLPPLPLFTGTTG
jgi:hypothetical protein